MKAKILIIFPIVILLLLSFVSALSITDDLRVYYPLNETSGTSFDDDGAGTFTDDLNTNSGYPIFLNGTDCVDGGNCINLSGQGAENDGVNSAGAMFRVGYNKTLLIWARPVATASNNRAFFGNGDGLRVFKDASGNFACQIRDNGGTFYDVDIGTVASLADQWHFFACFYNATSDQIGGSVDGGSITWASAGTGEYTNVLRYGGLGGKTKTQDVHAGVFQHAIGYETILTEDQVITLMNETNGTGSVEPNSLIPYITNPLNNSVTDNSSPVSFVGLYSGPTATASLKVFINGTLNATNSSADNYTAWSFPVYFPVGVYNITLQANDSTNIVNTSIFITINEPVSVGNRSFLNYTGVVNRSVCASTVIGSDVVCFRNDTQSLIGDDYIYVMDVVNSDTDFSTGRYQNTQALHYLGSQFRTTDRKGVPLPVCGVGSMSSAQITHIENDYLDVMTFGCRASKINRYEWRPDMYQIEYVGGVGDTPNQAIEMRVAAISEYAFVLQGSFKCTNSAGCNGTDSQSVRLEHETDGGISPITITYENNISGTGLDGFKSENLETASSWMGSDANITSYIVCNVSPDNYSISGRQGYLYWNIDYLESVNLTCVWVAEPDLSNLDSYLSDPVSHIDAHTAVVQDWMNMFKVPNSSYARGSDENMSRAIHHALFDPYYSTVKGYAGRPSLYTVPETEYCFMSATGAYKGHWVWDGFFQGMGLLAACKNNSACYSVVEDNFDCLWYYQNSTTGRLAQNVRDTYSSDSTFQAPGGWDMVVRTICNSDFANSTWCANSYEQLKLNHQWHRGNSDDDSDNVFEWLGVSSGWDDSVRFRIEGVATEAEAVDYQGWMILSAEAILNLSNTYNTSDTSTYSQYVSDYTSAASELWDGDTNMFYDTFKYNSSFISDVDGLRITPASGWALAGNFANSSQASSVMAHWSNTTTLSAYSSGYGILPTLSRDSDCFTEGASGVNPLCASTDAKKWNGRNWAPVWVMNFLGAKRVNSSVNAELVRDGALKSYYDIGITQESWNSQDGTNPSQGSFAAENFPGFGGGSFAVLEYDWDYSFVATSVNDTTSPVLSNFYSSASLTQVLLSVQSDELVTCTFNYGTSSSLGTLVYDSSLGSGCSVTINGLTENTTYFWNVTAFDASGNNFTNGTFNTSTQLTYSIDWEAEFNEIDADYMGGLGFLHWSFTDAWYQQEPNVLMAYMDMYEATGDVSYLNKTDVHFQNWTSRYGSWGTNSGELFVEGHFQAVMARYIYLANHSGDSYSEARAQVYLTFIENMTSSYDERYVQFNHSGNLIAVMAEDGLNRSEGMNRWVYYTIGQGWLYNVTSNTTYAWRAQNLSAGLLATFNSTLICDQDPSKLCHTNAYRFYFGESWETGMTGSEWGLPDYDEALNYGTQELEAYYHLWRHGYFNDTIIERVANAIYYNMYQQNGAPDNILLSRSWDNPSNSYSNWHQYGLTHHGFNIGLYKHLISNITVVSQQIRNDTYSWASDGDNTYTYFTAGGYPYMNITDPNTGTVSSYTESDAYSRITPDQLLKHISVSLLNVSVLNTTNSFVYFVVDDSVVIPVDGVVSNNRNEDIINAKSVFLTLATAVTLLVIGFMVTLIIRLINKASFMSEEAFNRQMFLLVLALLIVLVLVGFGVYYLDVLSLV